MTEVQLKEILNQNPRDFAALRALDGLYETEGRFEEQVEILKPEAEAAPDASERAWLTYRRARIQEEKLKDPGKALESYASVQGDDVWERLAFRARERILRELRDAQGLAALLSAPPASLQDADKEALALEHSRILAHRLNQPERAGEILREIVGEKPDDLFCALSLLQILISAGSWEEVARIYQEFSRLAQAVDDSALKAASAYRLAQIYEGRLGRPEQAMELYRTAAGEEKPADLSLAMMELLESSGESPEEWVSLLAQTSAEKDPGMFDLFSFKLACLQESELKKPEEAARTLEKLVEKKPDHLPGLLALERLCRSSGEREKSAKVISGLVENIDDPAPKLYYIELLSRIALDDLSQPEDALEYALKARQLAPDRVGPTKFLQYLSQQKGDWSGLVSLLDDEIERAGDPRELQGLYFWKAEVANYGLRKPELAVESYRQTLEVPPSQFPALKSLERLFHQTGDWENLIRVITALARLLTEKDYKIHYTLETARLWEEKLNRDDQAFSTYSEAVKADPENWAALAGIARVCLKQGAWDNLIAATRRLLSMVKEVPLQHAMLFEIAQIHERDLNQRQKAAEIYQSLVSLWPENPIAYECLRRQSFKDLNLAAYLEQLKALQGQAQSPEIKAAFLARAALVQETGLGQAGPARADYESAFSLVANPCLFLPLFELAQIENEWDRYVALATEFAPRFNNQLESALLWHTAQVMGEKESSDAASVLDLLKRSNELAPDHPVTNRALSGAFSSAKDYPALLALFEKELERTDGTGRLELRLARAEIIRDSQDDHESAIQEYLAAAQDSGDRVDIIRELEYLYEKAQNYSELIRIILKEVPLRKDTRLLISLYLRLARLYEEKFSADDQAVKAYQAILKLKEDHLESLGELSRLYEKAENWQELVKTLHARIQTAAEKQEQIELHLRSAKILDEKLEQVEQAIESLQKALDIEPSRKETLSELERIFDRENRHRELVDVLEKQTSLSGEPDVLLELHSRVAVLWEEKLNDNAKAMESRVKARDIQPENEPTLRALERLFEIESRWEDLIDTLERLAGISADPSARIEFHLRIGSLWEEKMDRPEPAISSLRRVLEADSGHVQALKSLDRLYQRTENYSALVEVLLTLVEAVSEDISQCIELLLRVGRIQEEKFENQDQALAAYGQAMDKDTAALEPIRASRSLRERRDEWADVVALWEKEEPLVPEPEGKKVIFFTIGDILENRLDKREESATRYEKALEIDGEYLPAVKPLAEIYFDAKAWERAKPLYEIWSKQAEAEGVDKAAQIFYRQGWISEQLQDVDSALQNYQRSSEIKPVYLPPLERLSDLYLAQENFGQAEVFFEKVLEIEKEQQNTERVFEVLSLLGEIEVKLEKTDAAIGRYEDALALKPTHYDTLRAVIPLYLEKQDWQKLLAIYDQAIRNAPSDELIANGLVEKGDVLEKHLSQVESATAHYQKSVEVMPDYLPGWEHLGEVYIKQKQWPEATGSLERLIELEQSADKRTDYNYRLGKIYQEGFNDLDKAGVYFEAALKLNETHIPSMEAIGLIYLRQKEWNKYLDMTHRFVKLIPKEEQEKAVPMYLKMGEVYRDFLEQKEKAIIEFQNVTRISSDHEDARSALAALYISDKNFYNNAIKENMILLRRNPFRVQSYRDLGKIFEGLNRLDEVYCIYSVLDVMKSLNPTEKMFFESHLPQVVKESKRSLNEESHEKVLIHPDERGPLHDMLVLMCDYFEKVFPPDLEKLGAKKTFKAQPTSTAPMKKLVDELAHNLGIEQYDLYLIPTSTEPRVANTTPPSLIINQEWFNPFKPEERRFLIGRALEHLKSRHALILNFSPEKVVKTLFLLAKLYKPDIQVPGLSESEIQSEMKIIKRAVPRKIRNQLEKAAVAFATEGAKADVNKWLKGINHTANRAGLLVANNLPASISAVMKTHPKFKKMRYDDLGDPIPILEQSDEVVEMIMFAISDAYFTLRRRTGFSLLSI